jgi:NTE family protein
MARHRKSRDPAPQQPTEAAMTLMTRKSATTEQPSSAAPRRTTHDPHRKPAGQVVLVLQGGGALGAYQAGVYQGLSEAGIEPDWVIGTSIGAINAALIAGNRPADRLDRLKEFWDRVQNRSPLKMSWLSLFGNAFANAGVLTQGVPGFFQPNLNALWGIHYPAGPGLAAYYGTDPLKATLADLIDTQCLNSQAMRVTVGAVNVGTGQMRYFDSRDMALDIQHVMASGALPPAFPAIEIDGALYWDGGVYSNTPIEVVFDDMPRRDGLIFTVDLWQPHGELPETLWQVMNRQKDIQYSSRGLSHVARQQQLHRLRHVVRELTARLPQELAGDPKVAELASYGCGTTMHLVRLLAPRLAREDHTKDIDFSAEGIGARWQAGYDYVRRVIAREPWACQVDALSGVLIHEMNEDSMVKQHA